MAENKLNIGGLESRWPRRLCSLLVLGGSRSRAVQEPVATMNQLFTFSTEQACKKHGSHESSAKREHFFPHQSNFGHRVTAMRIVSCRKYVAEIHPKRREQAYNKPQFLEAVVLPMEDQ